MLVTMTSAGLDPAECETAIRRMEHDPVFLAARKMQQLQRKLESVLANQQKLWEMAPDYSRVEKRPRITRSEFVTRHVIGSRPLVLTGLTRDWPAMKRWSAQDLKTRFGHLDVEIQAERCADPNYEENKLAHRRKLRLADIGSLPDFCDHAELPRLSSFWFGPAGTNTPLHHDTVMLFHTQVVGRKRWRFISPLQTPRVYNHHGVFSPIDLDAPDFERYPLFRDVKVLEAIIEPGETVYLPLGWWHQVTALDMSLSFSYSNIAVPNLYTYQNPEIRNW
jgi:hypothetical protein